MKIELEPYKTFAEGWDLDDPSCPPRVLAQIWLLLGVDITERRKVGFEKLAMQKCVLMNPNTPSGIIVRNMINGAKWAWRNPLAHQLALTNPSKAMSMAAKLMDEEAKAPKPTTKPISKLLQIRQEFDYHSEFFQDWFDWIVKEGAMEKP